MRVGGALIECTDRGVLAKEAMVGMDLGTMDGRGGGCAAPWLSDACELTAEVFLKLVCGVLLDVGGNGAGGVGEAKVEGEEEWSNASASEV